MTGYMMLNRVKVLEIYEDHLKKLLKEQERTKGLDFFGMAFKVDSIKYIISLIEKDIKGTDEVKHELYE
jgi:hypothetical protein